MTMETTRADTMTGVNTPDDVTPKGQQNKLRFAALFKNTCLDRE